MISYSRAIVKRLARIKIHFRDFCRNDENTVVRGVKNRGRWQGGNFKTVLTFGAVSRIIGDVKRVSIHRADFRRRDEH